MQRVLYVGQDPDTVDYSDPALPPGADAAKIRAGIDLAVRDLAARGWQVDTCMISPDGAGLRALSSQLTSATYACVVIGGGMRIPPKSLLLFERVLNTVHQAAPQARIAFNTRPEDTAEAAARWVDAG
ncbi:hypothetical protein [Luteimonas salinilitoris]|uniref:Uncharacterized protein n=1 Tax=Luteimonas salinilitoris TaxID=3237697 RepID=A0ABV4HY41_9GAMM